MLPPRAILPFLAATAIACGERERGPALQPDDPLPSAPAAESARHSVTIHEPTKLTSIETHETDATGRALRVSCVTCHTLRGPSPLPTQTSSLQQFHNGLTLEHGALACASCHDPAHPQSLRLADATALPMLSVMRLCSQCHGPQRRDYDHGAHGGMNGYWDLTRGPRLRNNCVDCHDPHAPKFAGAYPVLPPRDRLLDAPHTPEPSHD